MYFLFSRHVGASEGHLDVVKFLVLQPGIDVNAEDKNHFTALLGRYDNQFPCITLL